MSGSCPPCRQTHARGKGRLRAFGAICRPTVTSNVAISPSRAPAIVGRLVRSINPVGGVRTRSRKPRAHGPRQRVANFFADTVQRGHICEIGIQVPGTGRKFLWSAGHIALSGVLNGSAQVT